MLKKYNLNLNQFLDLKHRIRDKKVIYNVILVILIVFWDTVIPSIGHFLPAIGHVLYLALEVINTIIEHFLLPGPGTLEFPIILKLSRVLVPNLYLTRGARLNEEVR